MSNGQDRPLGELFAELSRESSLLLRSELALAKAEILEKATSATKPLKVAGLGGMLLHAGMLGLTAAAVLGLSEWWPLWLSALLVGGVLVVVGGIAARTAWKQAKHIDPVPGQTVKTLKEDKIWLTQQIR